MWGIAEFSDRFITALDWKAGFLLGAVVSTTDAITATSIAKSVGLPRRIVDILEGESLVNDATGLLALEIGLSIIVRGQTPTVTEDITRLLYPTGCQDVVISDCIIDTGDDVICLKSESLDGTPARLSRNIVTNCILTGCCNGFKFGTTTFGGFENITFSNSVIYNDDVPLSSRVIAGIQLSAVDGGWVDGVVISGIQMRRVRAPISLRRGTRHTDNVTPQNGMRGIVIDGLHATDAVLTSSITGLPGMYVEDVRLSDVRIATVMPGRPEWVPQPVPEAVADYPQSRMFGWLPASGLYVRHVLGLSMRNVSFSAPVEEWRPTLVFDDVRDLRCNGLHSTPAVQGKPMLQMGDVNGAWLCEIKAPQGGRALLKLKSSKDILISGCDLRGCTAIAEGDANGVHGQYNMLEK